MKINHKLCIAALLGTSVSFSVQTTKASHCLIADEPLVTSTISSNFSEFLLSLTEKQKDLLFTLLSKNNDLYLDEKSLQEVLDNLTEEEKESLFTFLSLKENKEIIFQNPRLFSEL